MSVTIARIHAGAGRVFVGVTVGVTGTPPTYITHTDGVPGSGTDVGGTQGDAIFSYVATKKEIEIEQSLAPVKVIAINEIASIECTVLEAVYTTLQYALDNVGKEDIAAGEAFYFGDGTSILAPTTGCVMVTSRQPDAPTKFWIVVLYKCYVAEAFKLPFSKAKETTYKLTLKGLADLTRNAGDRVGYLRYETTA